MEIGHQPVDRLEAITGGDEDRRIAFERLDGSVFGRGALDQAERGGADRNQPPAGRPRRIQPIGRGLVGPSPLAVHPVIAGVIRLDRKEGSGTDVQSQRLAPDSAPIERCDQPIREMQGRRRRRHPGTTTC